MGGPICALSGAVIPCGDPCFWGYFHVPWIGVYTPVWPGVVDIVGDVEVTPDVRARAEASICLHGWKLPQSIRAIERDEKISAHPRLVILHPETVARAIRLTGAQATVEYIAENARRLWDAGPPHQTEYDRYFRVAKTARKEDTPQGDRVSCFLQYFHFAPRAAFAGPEEIAATARAFAAAQIASLLRSEAGFPFLESFWPDLDDESDKARRKAVREILGVGRTV